MSAIVSSHGFSWVVYFMNPSVIIQLVTNEGLLRLLTDFFQLVSGWTRSRRHIG